MVSEKSPHSSTSIFAFQQEESLAGLVTRCGHLSEKDFLSKYRDPFLLTSMPAETSLAVWAIILPVRKKQPRGSLEKTLSREAKALYEEIAGKKRIYVGRAPECDIVLAPKSVSRRHVAFDVRNDVWHIMDLRATNGTRIDNILLSPRVPTALARSPAKIEFGGDTALWFILPADFFHYINAFKRQIEDTAKDALSDTSENPLSQKAKEKAANDTPPDHSLIAKVEKPKAPQAPANPTATQIAVAEAETNAMIRAAERQLDGTWHGDETDDHEPRPKRPILPSLKGGDPEPKLIAAIRAVAALDSLILTVVVQLKTDARKLVIYSSQAEGQVTDVADQLIRLGPMLKAVVLTLSVGDGNPVEIYTA